MHIDGIQELHAVDGYDIILVNKNNNKKSNIYSYSDVKKI